MQTHDGMCGFDHIRRHVKKGAGADGSKYDAGAVLVRLDAEIDAGFREELFEAKGVLKALGDVDEHGFFAFEEGGVLFHFSDFGRSRAAIAASPGESLSRRPRTVRKSCSLVNGFWIKPCCSCGSRAGPPESG